MITHERAKLLCSQWHAGQGSALYQFSSTGIFSIDNFLKYLRETEDCLHPEYDLHPGTRGKRDIEYLTRLQQYFEFIGLNLGLKVKWETQELYGYRIPRLTEDVPKELRNQVTQIKYLP